MSLTATRVERCTECGHDVPGLAGRVFERLWYATAHQCHADVVERWMFEPEECCCSAACHR
jgi:hypothetical protein